MKFKEYNRLDKHERKNVKFKDRPLSLKLIMIFVGLVFMFFIGTCTKSCLNGNSEIKEKSAIVDSTLKNEVKKPNWEYTQKTDSMDNKVIYWAISQSLNQHEFDFPYNGGSNMNLQVRFMNGRNEILLAITKGQFLAYNEYVRIKFDDGQAFKYTINSTSDGSSDYIFVNGANSIISALKKAKKCMIEAPFYQSGRVSFNFNIEGLDWKH